MADGEPLHAPSPRLFLSSMLCFNLALRRPDDELLIKHNFIDKSRNSCRRRAWKTELQAQLADRFHLNITVAHYPTGASKWNPIEHRLFSEISKNWAGEPLDSYQKILNFIRTTSTKTGLAVTAYLDRHHYPTGTEPT